jgi:glycosyltransferase involved in cell wall biosynthesis
VKVLILHQHFNTPEKGGPLRSYYLAKALISKGHEVFLITGYSGKDYKKENVEGIEVHYLPIPYHNRFNFTARSKAFIQYVFGVVKIAKQLNVDVCYAISVPLTVGIAAVWNKFRRQTPFIFEVGDLWPDAPIEMSVIKNPIFKWALYRLEQFIYNDAKSIVALSPSIKKRIENKVRSKNIFLVPNMADTDFFKPEKKDIALEKKFNTENKFVVSYIGALGVANGLSYFLECARASQKAELPIQFFICGDGGMVESLKKSAALLSLQNLSFIEFQNREGVRQLLNITDASFICYKPLPILETGSPNKYFDGLAAGKLIIINFGGWIREEIERQKCGIYLDSKHPTEFVKKIRPFLEDAKLLNSYRENASRLAESNYSRHALSEKFASIIKNG